jgi:hypothetical protein
MSASAIVAAREIAAEHLIESGRSGEADIVRKGGGDDFPEVQIALRAITRLAERIGRLERALDHYADEAFWGGGDCHAALAFHDSGTVARQTLDGKDPLAMPAG